MSGVVEGRDVSELRVVDLRAELEKRGLDKSGNKQVLVERLQKALQEEKDHPEKKIDFKAVKTEVKIKAEPLDENGEDTDLKEELTVAKVEALNTSATSTEAAEDKKEEKMEEETEEVADMDADASIDKADTADVSKCDGDADGEADDTSAINASAELDKSNELTLHADQSSELDVVAKVVDPDPEEIIDLDDSIEEDESAILDEEKDKDYDPDTKTVQVVKSEVTNGKAEKGDEVRSATKDESAADKDKDKIKKKEVVDVDAKEKPKEKEKDKDDKDKMNISSSSPSKIKDRLTNDQNRNLWITNISQTTRATELKQALSEHGKVVGAKVVINARHPAACCYGYVRMESVADADNCIAKLNNTELNGQIIRIEKVRPDHLNPSTKGKTDSKEKPSTRTPIKAPTPTKNADDGKKERKLVEAPKDERKEKSATGKHDEKKSSERRDSKGNDSRDKEKTERERRDRDKRPEVKDRSAERKSAGGRSASRDRKEKERAAAPLRPGVRKERDILTFDKIKTERERERLKERERIMRNRRREESERVKEIERHQRSEAIRLERERDKLKQERERLERERAEFLQLERERQKMERQKIELERLELERAKLRIQEEERRAVKRPAPTTFRERERSYEDRKRSVTDRHFVEEAPPPPRFDGPSSIKAREPSPPPVKKFSNSSSTKDYTKGRISYEKRDTYPPKRDYDERTHSSTISRSSTGGGGGAPPPVPKYESSSSSSYQRDRDMRGAADPRVRSSGGGSSGISASTKYTSSDSKPRYSDRERERERSPHFSSSSRTIRDERDRRSAPDKLEIRSSRDHRYPETKVESVRYDRTSSSSGNNWSQPKTFTPTNSSSSKQWNKETWRSEGSATSSDRWNSSSQHGTAMSSGFSSNPSMNMGPSCPPPPGLYDINESMFNNDAL